AALGPDAPLADWTAFARAVRLKPALLKKLRPHVAVRYDAAAPVPGEADPELRDTETVPLRYPGGVDAFFEKEVLPFAPDAWIDASATRIGYEVSFTKYFYKPVPLRPLDAIAADLRNLETETAGLLDRILEG
ncbi:MAG: SAM-dependent DNA methyltransferase, partial [Kiritimatiellae bacterium]|nr:SAM-dependent DNA methyltransferase [Kiritimatiellia bacterium]